MRESCRLGSSHASPCMLYVKINVNYLLHIKIVIILRSGYGGILFSYLGIFIPKIYIVIETEKNQNACV